MNRKLRIIIIGAVTIIFCYFAYFLYGIVRYSHIPSRQTYKQYMWIFKDSIKIDIDSTFCYSYVRKRDIYNNFHYRGIYNFIIWEFKDQITTELKDVLFIQNANLDKIKFRSGQVLNKDSDLEINIKNGFSLSNSMNFYLDEFSKIERSLIGPNYKGFYGFINNMTLGDEKDRHQIIFDYTKGRTPTVLLIYKGHQSFYLIMINSDGPFEESIINILNLE
jgi:hypothetical protein